MIMDRHIFVLHKFFEGSIGWAISIVIGQKMGLQKRIKSIMGDGRDQLNVLKYNVFACMHKEERKKKRKKEVREDA